MSAADQKPLGSGFHAKSEPENVLQGIDLIDKNVIVTGGYSGIGLETVRALANAGANITVPARDLEKAQTNLAGMLGNIVIQPMDLAEIASVRSFAGNYSESHNHLDLLINNAGIMACPEGRVGPGWERQFGTNHMGHFALTIALLPLLAKAKSPRVVALSSIAHQLSGMNWDDVHFDNTPYEKWKAYGQAKTADALFAVGLSQRMRDFGGRAFSVHPGGIFTPLQRHVSREEQVAMGWLEPDGQFTEGAKAMFKTPPQGCATTLWTATSPMLDDKHGLYCEDCDVAQLKTPDSPRYSHVASHAVDSGEAERLWAYSEELLASV